VKIAIISPNLSGDISILDIGVTTLATYVNQRSSHHAVIWDFSYHRKDWDNWFARKIETERPDVIGISATSLYLQYIRKTLKALTAYPEIPVVVGGYHASLEPEKTLAMDRVDAVIRGEGEYSLVEYLDRLQKGRAPDGIPGLDRKDENGSPIIGPRPSWITDIESLPMADYDLWEDLPRFLRFNQMVYFLGNRGCPFGCSYCSNKPVEQVAKGHYYREKDPINYVAEIEAQYAKYKNRGMRIAHCFDAVFTANSKWLAGFADRYIASGLHKQLPLSVFSRADTLDPERIEQLVKMNCKVVRIGIEAGDEQYRNEVYEKKISDSTYRKTFAQLQKAGIAITGYNIIGGPGETPQTLRRTFEMVKELKVDRPIFFTYRPLPRTGGVEKVKQLGGWIDDAAWEKIDSLHGHSNVNNPQLPAKMADRFRTKCLVYFNLIRALKLVRKQGPLFFVELIRWIIDGKKAGVPLQYSVGYFLVCGKENLFH
jgi:radical SAM superfamily enzyme YgiQ (UPF0313 family)